MRIKRLLDELCLIDPGLCSRKLVMIVKRFVTKPAQTKIYLLK